MTRDLPNSIPSAVQSAAQAAIDESEDVIQRAADAKRAYTSAEYRRYAEECRAHVMFDDLPAKAQALIDWGAMLQKHLPPGLAKRFRAGRPMSPCLSVVRHEIALAARPGFQGGMLATELQLELDPEMGLFRHYDKFDGFRMTGGGLLNTQNSLFYALHPEMLNRIHAIVAEGRNWRHIEVALNGLVEAFKDR